MKNFCFSSRFCVLFRDRNSNAVVDLKSFYCIQGFMRRRISDIPLEIDKYFHVIAKCNSNWNQQTCIAIDRADRNRQKTPPRRNAYRFLSRFNAITNRTNKTIFESFGWKDNNSKRNALTECMETKMFVATGKAFHWKWSMLGQFVFDNRHSVEWKECLKHTKTNKHTLISVLFDILSNRYECQTKWNAARTGEIFTFSWSRATQQLGSANLIPTCLCWCFCLKRRNKNRLLRIKLIITGNSTSNNGKILPIIEIIWSLYGIDAANQDMPTIWLWCGFKERKKLEEKHQQPLELASFELSIGFSLCVVCIGLSGIIDCLWYCQFINGPQPHFNVPEFCLVF